MAARGRAAGALLLLGILATPGAFGLNPALDTSQYAHTAWKISDGFAKGQIFQIAQTSDGYLWLATVFGLLRFDGVRTIPFQPPTGQRLPSDDVRKLVEARDGTLWIGTAGGLASWKNGKLTQYAELAGLAIFALLEDRAGSLWVGAYGVPDGKLCEIRSGSVRCQPEMDNLGPGVFGLHEDGKGNLWVGLSAGVWRWKPGPPQFYPLPDLRNGIQNMIDDRDGSLLLAMPGGVRRLISGKVEMAYPLPVAMKQLEAQKMLRDRDGGFWVGTSGRGLMHIHHGRTDVFSQPDGLSGNFVTNLFEDREGDLWAATVNGLDRFRELSAVTYSTNQGLSTDSPWTVLGARDGSIWIGSIDRLNRLQDNRITVYGERTGLPAGITSLFDDSSGRVWLSTQAGVGYLENERFRLTQAPGGRVDGFAEDSAGNLWMLNQDLGLVRLSPANEVEDFPWITFGHRDPALAVAADSARGGIWLGFYNGGVVYFGDGRVRASYSIAEGLAGRVNQLRFDGRGELWAATEGGLSRLKDGRIATLASKNGLPCDAVQWMAEDEQSVWLNMPCGLARVARAELDLWASATDKTRQTIHATVFDSADGVRSSSVAGAYHPQVAKSSNGRLWFVGPGGLNAIDPRNLPFNKLPPPVHIEQITADRKIYAVSEGRLRLPPLIRDLQIDYTGLSLVAPEKMRFRYKLEGRDRDWIEAGTRRQAFYSDLAPRNYRFRVAASNNSGVWNEAGAFLDFGVAPAYYQTAWFRAAFLAVLLALLAGLYQLRLHYLKRQLQVRMEERVNERTRLARDLHDTLLQSFQGVLLKFQAVTYLFPDRAEEAPKTLAAVIEEARAAIVEGRDAVYGLRASTVITNDLAKAIHTLGEELAADRQGQPCPECRVQVEGESRDLLPLVRDEVYRIGGEAVRNAFRHAQATRIEVDIHYDRRVLRLRVRDDGKGLDPKILSEGGRAGHFGLPGMHERAKLVGGQLAVWSEADSGTEVELTIPASVAYSKPPERRTLFARRHLG